MGTTLESMFESAITIIAFGENLGLGCASPSNLMNILDNLSGYCSEPSSRHRNPVLSKNTVCLMLLRTKKSRMKSKHLDN